MKRKCHATGPHHNDRCNGGRVQCPNAQFTQPCDHCHGTGEVEGHRASTPITADGLRGLGMTDEGNTKNYGEKFSLCFQDDDNDDAIKRLLVYRWLPRGGWFVAVASWDSEWDDEEPEACDDEVPLGTAPDLEWVAAMIALLKRANGKGAC
mgnify:CR=1 FL=1